MARSKGKKSSKRSAHKSLSALDPYRGISLPDLVETAHVHLAQQDFANGIACLKAALGRDEGNAEVKELLGIAECEGGDVDAGRKLLLDLLPPKNPSPSSSIYLYLAQTADDPRDALDRYESAINILLKSLESDSTAGMTATMESGKDGEEDEVMEDATAGEEEEEEEIKGEARKDVVTALIAMVEIWMSDLCFEDDAPAQCDALITRALAILPNDVDARITLANIRMSQSKPEEARGVVLKAAQEVLAKSKRMELDLGEGEDVDVDKLVESAESATQTEGDSDSTDFPPLPTRRLLARLLLEHSLYTLSLRVIDTVRNEDELDVEGCYLEGWAWYCRGEAIGAGGEEAEGVTVDAREFGEDEEVIAELSKEGCWSDALASLAECKSLHEASDHPDEGILAHTLELMETLEKAGVVLEIEDDGEEEPSSEAQTGGADVDMS